jgi:tetratricopeptide (TPR) repeat protein
MNQIDQENSQKSLAENPWWDEDLPSSDEENYQGLVRAVRRNVGFGLIFVSCSQQDGDVIVGDLTQDLPQRNFYRLSIAKPIDNLFDLVAKIPDLQNINTVFVEGLEDSIFAYEDREFEDINLRSRSGVYGGTVVDAPLLFTHLNMQRERFKDNFATCFIFLVRDFTLNYFVRRAPDFFDWRSHSFKFSSSGVSLAFMDFTDNNSILEDGSNEKMLSFLDKYLEIQSDNYRVWVDRGFILQKLGRYEEAEASFDRALSIQPNYREAFGLRSGLFHR